MDLDSYQELAKKYRTKDTPDSERMFGLFEEAGEVAGVAKRMQRGDYKDDPEIGRQKLKKELGDTLWYLSQVAKDNGFALQEVAVENLHKLEDRLQRGTLKGTGDNR